MGTHDHDSSLVSRRTVLAGGAAGLGGLLVGNLLGSATAGASPSTGYQAVPEWGKARQVIWANGASGTWDLSYDVGMNDAARFLGWSYKKVAMPQASYSATQVAQTINEAIALKPDVLVTPDWVEGEGDLLSKAQKSGIFVIVSNADNYPDQLTTLNIAACTSNPNVLGQKSGTVLMDYFASKGTKEGTIIGGNPYPQNTNQQGIWVGCQSAVEAANKANGSNFDFVELADNSGADEVGAVALWKAKIAQLGSKFVGGFCVADASTTAAVKAYQTSGFKPGQYPLACIDVTTPSLASMQEGWVLCLVDAGIYTQGWMAVMFSWQYLERGYAPSGAIDCSGAAVTKATLAAFSRANNLQITLGKDYNVLVA